MVVGIDAYPLFRGSRALSWRRYVEGLYAGFNAIDDVSPADKLLFFGPPTTPDMKRGRAIVQRLFPFPKKLWRPLLAVAAACSGCDVIHYTMGGVWRLPGQRVVTTVMDVRWNHFDSGMEPAVKLALDAAVKELASKVRLVITPSRATMDELVHYYDFPSHRIRVIPLGVRAPGSSIATYGDRQLRFLQVGMAPVKNVVRVIQAFGLLYHRLDGGITLALVGGDDNYGKTYWATVYSAIRDSGASHAIQLHRTVDDPELDQLYQTSIGLVLCSHFEGFGLPALEAMRAGTPVVASRVGALPEVVGGGGLLADHLSPESIAKHMESLLDRNKWRCLSAEGLLRARELSWQSTARATLMAYRELLG